MPKSPWQTVEQTYTPAEFPVGYTLEGIPEGIIEVNNLSAGMIDRLPRDKVPQGSSRNLVNARIRDDWVGRREGTELFGPTKPDSNKILKIITFVHEDGSVSLCRITASGFHVADVNGSSWTSFSILDADGSAATFPTNARISFAQFFNFLYLADGSNPVWEVNFDAGEVKQIDGAPRAKFVANFGDRIVAGYVGLTVGGWRPSGIAWSDNADPRTWNGISSGFEDLGNLDLGDYITGLVGFEDELVILRRKSIAHGTRQPFAAAPFRFRTIISGIGCDLPYTAAKVPSGILFADQRTRGIYAYQPGARPQEIAAGVNRTILEDLGSMVFAEATYDPFEKEYHLGIVESGETNITRVWVSGLEFVAWSYDDDPEVSTLGVVSVPGDFTAIDDLTGTVDNLSGTIDSFGEEGEFTPALFKGTATGEIIRQTFNADDDWDETTTSFEWTFQSPNLGAVSRERTLQKLGIQLIAPSNGDVVLSHSKDESTWGESKTISLTGATTAQRVFLNRARTGEDLFWRLVSSAPKIKMKSWFAKIIEKTLQQ